MGMGNILLLAGWDAGSNAAKQKYFYEEYR